jgi:hypothetical protein
LQPTFSANLKAHANLSKFAAVFLAIIISVAYLRWFFYICGGLCKFAAEKTVFTWEQFPPQISHCGCFLCICMSIWPPQILVFLVVPYSDCMVQLVVDPTRPSFRGLSF